MLILLSDKNILEKNLNPSVTPDGNNIHSYFPDLLTALVYVISVNAVSFFTIMPVHSDLSYKPNG